MLFRSAGATAQRGAHGGDDEASGGGAGRLQAPGHCQHAVGVCDAGAVAQRGAHGGDNEASGGGAGSRVGIVRFVCCECIDGMGWLRSVDSLKL